MATSGGQGKLVPPSLLELKSSEALPNTSCHFFMQGKFSLNRELLNHQIWLRDKFSHGQAWVDLIGLANHKPGCVYVRGIRIDLERGEVGWSMKSLMARWRRSRDWITKWFTELEKDEMITLKILPQIFTVITIKNYNKYQWESPQTIPQTIPQTVPQTVHKSYHKSSTNNNDNNGNNVKEKRNNFVISKKEKKSDFQKSDSQVVDELLKDGTKASEYKIARNSHSLPQFYPQKKSDTKSPSQISLSPCTLRELTQIASELEIYLVDVVDTHELILDLIRDGTFVAKKYGKTTYFTLRNWLRKKIADGRIKKIDENEKIMRQNESRRSPDVWMKIRNFQNGKI